MPPMNLPFVTGPTLPPAAGLAGAAVPPLAPRMAAAPAAFGAILAGAMGPSVSAACVPGARVATAALPRSSRLGDDTAAPGAAGTKGTLPATLPTTLPDGSVATLGAVPLPSAGPVPTDAPASFGPVGAGPVRDVAVLDGAVLDRAGSAGGVTGVPVADPGVAPAMPATIDRPQAAGGAAGGATGRAEPRGRRATAPDPAGATGRDSDGTTARDAVGAPVPDAAQVMAPAFPPPPPLSDVPAAVAGRALSAGAAGAAAPADAPRRPPATSSLLSADPAPAGGTDGQTTAHSRIASGPIASGPTASGPTALGPAAPASSQPAPLHAAPVEAAPAAPVSPAVAMPDLLPPIAPLPAAPASSQAVVHDSSVPPAPPPPATQVAQAVVHLAVSGAGSQVTVQLNPESLGRVQVQIDQSGDGPAHVSLTAERPETLALLQADQKQLDAVLTRSGLAEVGRTISFHAVPPAAGDAAPRDSPLAPPAPSHAGAGLAGADTGASSMPDRQAARGGTGETFFWTAAEDDTAPAGPSAGTPTLSLQRLDITA